MPSPNPVARDGPVTDRFGVGNWLLKANPNPDLNHNHNTGSLVLVNQLQLPKLKPKAGVRRDYSGFFFHEIKS